MAINEELLKSVRLLADLNKKGGAKQMTDEQKYAEVIKAIGELLNEKDTTIHIKSYELDVVRNKLIEAEKQLEELRKENQ